MSITAYVGLPGQGKSYGVVANVIAPALKANRIVYTNIPMKNEECLKRFKAQVVSFETQDLIDNKNWFKEVFEKGALIVIDELWRLWPAGLKANNAEELHKSFLAEHRHMVGVSGHSTEIVFVTQDLGQVASFARVLVETTFRMQKMTKLGLSKNFRVDVFSGCVTGPNPPISKREREIHGTFKKDIFALYHSHTQSDVGAGIETRTDDRYNVLKGSSFMFILGGLVIGVIILYWLGSKFLSNGIYAEKNVNSEQLKSQIVSINPVPQSTSASVLSKPKPKQVVNDVLSKSESIYYVSKQVYKVDNEITTIHLFKINLPDSYTFLNQYQLMALDYKVQIINDCFAVITGFGRVNYALCKSDEEKGGFIEDTILAAN